MGFLDGVFGVVGEVIKDSTGVDIAKGINTIKEGDLNGAIYEMRDDMEGKVYTQYRQTFRSMSDSDFKRINADNLNDVQMRAYEDERKRRGL